MAAEITEYQVFFFGSPAGFETNRVQVRLLDRQGKVIGWVRFSDPGMFFEDDYESGGVINMHMPSGMFQGVLDVLRNEKPLYLYFAQNRAFLSTSRELTAEME